MECITHHYACDCREAAFVRQRKQLQAKIKAQRTELRRLNKVLGPYWKAWRSGNDFARECTLRGKMIQAFGLDAVRKAEDAA